MGEQQHERHMGLLVGIPIASRKEWDTGRPVAPEWAATLANLVYPTGLLRSHMFVKGKRIDEARNEIIEKALELDAEYVFFLDDDVRPPVHILLHLMPLLNSAPDVIAAGGLYSIKREPTEPMAYRKLSKGPCYDFKYGEQFDVEGIATGALLVKVPLFKQIEKPWFKTIEESGQDKGRIYERRTTDDLYFCNKALKAGFKIKAHGGMLCDHIDAENHKIYNLNQYLPKAPSSVKAE